MVVRAGRQEDMLSLRARLAIAVLQAVARGTKEWQRRRADIRAGAEGWLTKRRNGREGYCCDGDEQRRAEREGSCQDI